APELLPGVEQAQRDLAFVMQLDDIRFRKWVLIRELSGTWHFNTGIAPREYSAAFIAHGLDLTALEPAEAGRRIAAAAVKAELVAAVDDWALYLPDEEGPLRDRLLEIAQSVDPGPWLNQLRNPILWGRKTTVLMAAVLAQLAADADPATTPSP